MVWIKKIWNIIFKPILNIVDVFMDIVDMFEMWGD